MADFTNCTVAGNDKFGWVNPPNIRGTIDIVYSCILIIFTSTWTVLHINVPAESDSFWTILLRKARWAVFAIYAPEAVTLMAGCQRASAKASVRNMHTIGVNQWTVVHGFFADSGGIILHPPDTPSFPVNSRALVYLVREKYLDAPAITEKDIWARSKADRFAKGVALVQSLYLVIQCIGRRAQSLELSSLELVTVAFVACTAVSFYLWMDKPLCVDSAVHLELTVPMARILQEAGDVASQPYVNTPMDFVEQPGWNVWKRRPWFRTFGGMEAKPIQRIPNDLVPPPFTLHLAGSLWALTCAYAAIHVTGWNHNFPTIAELLVWRISSLTLLVVLFAWGLVEVLSVKPGFDFTLTLLGLWEKKSSKNTFFRNWAVDAPATFSATLYFVARTVIIGETIASLRLMPGTVYQTVDWSNFIPHV